MKPPRQVPPHMPGDVTSAFAVAQLDVGACVRLLTEIAANMDHDDYCDAQRFPAGPCTCGRDERAELAGALASALPGMGKQQSENERLRGEVRDLRQFGSQLANAAFNLAQRDHLRPDERETLDKCRRLWDSTIDRHIAARAARSEEMSDARE